MRETVHSLTTVTGKFNAESHLIFRSLQRFKDDTGKINAYKLLDYLTPFIDVKANEYKQLFKKLVTFETDDYKSEMIIALIEVVNELNEMDHRLDFKSTYLRRCDRNIYSLVKGNTIASNLTIPKFTECIQLKDAEAEIFDEEGSLDLYKTALKEVYTTLVSINHIDDYIETDGIENIQVSFDAEINNGLLSDDLNKLLNTLTDREALILDYRFGLSDNIPRTLVEIGKELGVTKERIREIEAKALRKLRHPNRSMYIKCYLED